jgi:V-type H+-transporting ATPase subunit E
VKQEQQAIDAQFEKKRKGAETAQKMCANKLSSRSVTSTSHQTAVASHCE